MTSTWTKLVNLVIRPPRSQYDPRESLPGPRFRIGGVYYAREDLDLEGADGLRLACSHYRPEIPHRDPTSLPPCVVYLHGNSGSRCDAVDVARLLLPSGVTVFAFDFSGSGLSEGEHVALGAREVRDVAAVVAHLRSTGRVGLVGLWGQSMGAVTALLYANRDPSVAGIVLDSPFSSLNQLMLELVDGFVAGSAVPVPLFAKKAALGWMRSSVKSRAGFDVDDLDVIDTVDGSFCPALFAHGVEDDFIRPAHSEALFEKYAGDKEYLAFDGDHNSPRPAAFFDKALVFFMRALHPESGGSATTINAGAGAVRELLAGGGARGGGRRGARGDEGEGEGGGTRTETETRTERMGTGKERTAGTGTGTGFPSRSEGRSNASGGPGEVVRVRDVLASPSPGEARPGEAEARPAASSGETAASSAASGGRRERLDVLAAMGFASEAANAAALDACGDDLDAAVARLLDAADDGDDARGETGGGSQSQSHGGMMDAMADASDADLARAIRLSLADRSGDARGGRG